MENPLDDNQINELNEIVKLPREEQSKRLPGFLKKLDKDQIEFLKKHQTQQCLFCGIVLGNIKSYKIYEDEEFVAVLDINPANSGHVLIIPKAHLKNSYDTNPRIFDLANLIAKKIKEKLNADSNIFVANGENAGQRIEHLVVNVIPRYENDKINFNWDMKKSNEKELNELANKLKFQEEKKEVKKEKIIIKTKRKESLP